MTNNLPIKMKKTAQATRPSENTVLKSCTDSDLARYIRDIAKFPALSTEEEREIAKRVKSGDEEAKKILQKHKKDWETLAKALMEYETLTGDEIKDILAGKEINRAEQTPVPPEKRTKASVPEV